MDVAVIVVFALLAVGCFWGSSEVANKYARIGLVLLGLLFAGVAVAEVLEAEDGEVNGAFVGPLAWLATKARG